MVTLGIPPSHHDSKETLKLGSEIGNEWSDCMTVQTVHADPVGFDHSGDNLGQAL